MRRPQPTRMDTPLEVAAMLFAFGYYYADNVGVQVPASYVSVVRLRRQYNETRAQKFCECGRPVAKVPQPTLCERCRNQLFGVAA